MSFHVSSHSDLRDREFWPCVLLWTVEIGNLDLRVWIHRMCLKLPLPRAYIESESLGQSMKEPFSGRSQRRKLVGEEEEGTEAQREPPHHFRGVGFVRADAAGR